MRMFHSRWKTALIGLCVLGLLTAGGCSRPSGPGGDAAAGTGQSTPVAPEAEPKQPSGQEPPVMEPDGAEPKGGPDVTGAAKEPEPPQTDKPEKEPEAAQAHGTGTASDKAVQTPLPPETGAEKAPGTEGSSYDFSQPVPAGPEVDNSYFADAAFIGDSRTDGFMLYSGIGCGKNLSSNGLSIFKLKEKKALTIDGQKYTLLEALALEQYGKVYLSLGVNELGYNNDKGFYQKYCDAIETIRQLQPNAVIYIQGLIPLNEGVIAQTGGSSYLTNEHLRVYNDLMRKAAQEEGVVFLDLYSEFVDANGELPAEASKDGVHLRGAWCRQWLAYLKTHTVDYDTLYPSGGAAPMSISGGAEEQGQSDAA